MESGFLASEMALAIPEKIGLRLVIIRNFRMNLVAEVSRTKFDPYMLKGASEAAELVTKAHLSLTVASGKVGLYYKIDTNEWYLPIGAAPSTYIVKQSHVRLDGIVTNEQLCLQTAKNLGIDVPDSFVINVGTGKDEDMLFATHRYDRIIDEKCRVMDGLTVPFRLHQEDFCRELKNIGIGEKLAMKHYDDMLSRIESALEESYETLMQQGFIQAKDMKKRILEVRKPAWM